MAIAFFWFIFSCVASAIATNKGRFGFGYFLLSIFLTPLVGISCALVASRNVAYLEQQQVNNGSMRRCYSCDEIVRVEAIKCRHCGSELPAIPDINTEGWGYWLGSLFRASGTK